MLYSIYVWYIIVHLAAKRYLGWDERLTTSVLLELKPLFWPLAFARLYDVMNDPEYSIIDRGITVVGVLVGWYLLGKIDDDDRWKKRLKKLAEKVSVVGGKLAITPA